ncbi:uncharacterized protein LOC104007321 isoform X1 [Pan troglodytes]|uniref:uncharacterized protein LOC104007321 isoform X1 n=1 Tax=Pan troglodytes TaxID=9598 RepID=UPI0023EF7DCD|nr:uncharacterized protein LOC104007321 isoform X1 [Pan troglodytes]
MDYYVPNFQPNPDNNSLRCGNCSSLRLTFPGSYNKDGLCEDCACFAFAFHHDCKFPETFPAAEAYTVCRTSSPAIPQWLRDSHFKSVEFYPEGGCVDSDYILSSMPIWVRPCDEWSSVEYEQKCYVSEEDMPSPSFLFPYPLVCVGFQGVLGRGLGHNFKRHSAEYHNPKC